MSNDIHLSYNLIIDNSPDNPVTITLPPLYTVVLYKKIKIKKVSENIFNPVIITVNQSEILEDKLNEK